MLTQEHVELFKISFTLRELFGNSFDTFHHLDPESEFYKLYKIKVTYCLKNDLQQTST